VTRFLRRLAVSQFRSHAATALDLDARPVALFGPNGAGKTNLLEAVSTLSPGRGLRGAAVADMARAPGALGWRVRAALDTPEGLREIVVTGEPEGRRRVEIDGKPEPQAALGALAPMLWLTPAMDRLWTEGAEGRRRFLDRAALSFFPMHGAAALAYEKAMRERNRLLRDGPADPAWLSALEARMAEAGVAIAAARAATAARLIAAQQGVKTLFPMAEIGIIGPMEQRIAAAAEAPSAPPSEHPEIVEDFRAALARGRREDASAGRALVGPHRSDIEASFAAKGVPARLCSTGEQKALLISLVLANARALAAETGSAPILLLDEVAAHLDAERRAALFDEVCALGAQAWMTATGPELFEALGARARRFAVAEGAEGSTLREAA
jgi:DNA replication and repair protein RecF